MTMMRRNDTSKSNNLRFSFPTIFVVSRLFFFLAPMWAIEAMPPMPPTSANNCASQQKGFNGPRHHHHPTNDDVDDDENLHHPRHSPITSVLSSSSSPGLQLDLSGRLRCRVWGEGLWLADESSSVDGDELGVQSDQPPFAPTPLVVSQSSTNDPSEDKKPTTRPDVNDHTRLASWWQLQRSRGQLQRWWRERGMASVGVDYNFGTAWYGIHRGSATVACNLRPQSSAGPPTVDQDDTTGARSALWSWLLSSSTLRPAELSVSAHQPIGPPRVSSPTKHSSAGVTTSFLTNIPPTCPMGDVQVLWTRPRRRRRARAGEEDTADPKNNNGENKPNTAASMAEEGLPPRSLVLKYSQPICPARRKTLSDHTTRNLSGNDSRLQLHLPNLLMLGQRHFDPERRAASFFLGPRLSWKVACRFVQQPSQSGWPWKDGLDNPPLVDENDNNVSKNNEWWIPDMVLNAQGDFKLQTQHSVAFGGSPSRNGQTAASSTSSWARTGAPSSHLGWRVSLRRRLALSELYGGGGLADLVQPIIGRTGASSGWWLAIEASAVSGGQATHPHHCHTLRLETCLDAPWAFAHLGLDQEWWLGVQHGSI